MHSGMLGSQLINTESVTKELFGVDKSLINMMSFGLRLIWASTVASFDSIDTWIDSQILYLKVN